MKLKDYDALRRFMAATMLPKDAEALAAMRAANDILTANSLKWDDIFKRTVKIAFDNGQEPGFDGDASAARIENVFELLEGGKRWTDFVGSLYDQWQKRRWLSDKQKEALFKIAGEAE